MLFDKAILNRLYRYGYVLAGQESAAHDLLQDTVERCLKRPPAPLACPEAYARKVMRNRHIDLCRRRAASPESDEHDGNLELMAIDTFCLEELMISRQQLDAIWSGLLAEDREILYFWAVEDMTAAQIASITGSRRGTVLSRIHRLRKRLRAEMDSDAEAGDQK